MINTNRKITCQLATQITPPYCYLNIMCVQDEQRKIPPFKDPTYRYRRWSKYTMAKLLKNVVSYGTAVYAEFFLKRITTAKSCSSKDNVDTRTCGLYPNTHSFLITESLFSFWRIIPPPFLSMWSEYTGSEHCDPRLAYWVLLVQL